MKKLLFINACVRGEKKSKTLKLARNYIEEFIKSGKYRISERNLMESDIEYLSYDNYEKFIRESINISKVLGDFELATEFAKANLIVIAAPVWYYSYPAILSSYFENLAIMDITFRHTIHGVEGLCNAKKIVYIYTSGSILAPEDKIGERKIAKLAQIYKIPAFEAIGAEGLEIIGSSEQEIMGKASYEARKKARKEIQE
jgi:FMN-dependent NADH-azoreductase